MLGFILLQVFCLTITESQGFQNFSYSERNHITPLNLVYSGSGDTKNSSNFYPILANKSINYISSTTFIYGTAKETFTNKKRGKLKFYKTCCF